MIEIQIGQCLLKNLLDETKMTQQQLSDLTGIDKGQISGYVTNTRRSMSLVTAKKIAVALNRNIDELYEWKVVK